MSEILIDNFNEYQYLFEIVSAVINSKRVPKPINKINIETLYKISRENKFDSYLLYALNDNTIENVTEEFLQKAYFSLTKSINRSSVIDKTFCDIINLFEKNQIKNITLKGNYIKNYYPENELRYMIDIDILVNEYDMKKIDELLKNEGYLFKTSGNIENEYTSKDGVSIEIHKNLLNNTKKNNDFFDNVWDNAIIRKNYKYAYYLDEVTFYLYMVKHCLKHFFSGGFSARMVLDFYVFDMFISSEKINNEKNKKLKEINLYVFAKRIEEISNRWFSINGQGVEFNLLDKYIIENKAMCNKQNFVLVNAVAIDKKGKKINRINYLSSKVFLSYKNLSKYYSNLLGKPYMYLFYYFCYLGCRLKQLFSKGVKFKTLSEINDIENKKENITDMKNLISYFEIDDFIEYGG